MSYVLNPFTGKLDAAGVTTETDPLSLHLDQTTPQSVINGQPNFKVGLIADPTGTFDFTTIAGVPVPFGIYNPITNDAGGYNAVTYFTNSDPNNGATVGGLAFGGSIDGGGSYYGPSQATGLNGYVNVGKTSYTGSVVVASLTGQLSEGSVVDGFTGANIDFLVTGDGSTADNATGLKISLNAVDSGVITTAIGLNIGDIVAANAYSIKTGLGLVKFGDDVEMAGSLIGVTDLTLLSTTLGAEKLTNGTFTGNANGWTLGTGWTYNTNLVRKDVAGTGTLTQDLASMATPVIAGETYKLDFIISNNTVPSSTIKVMCGGVTLYWDFANNGNYTYTFKALTSTALTFDATSVSRYYIDTISLKRYAGTGNNFFAGNTYVENFISAGYTFQTQGVTEASPTTKMTILSNGNVGIGTVTPTAKLMIAAGTATTSTAPLKFTSGTLNTTAEAGAVEYLTDNLHFTIATGTARKGIVLDDGTRLTSGKIPVATTNGRLIDVTAQTELTDEDATATDGTDATQDQLINNMRTRINELETKLVALGLLVDAD